MLRKVRQSRRWKVSMMLGAAVTAIGLTTGAVAGATQARVRATRAATGGGSASYALAASSLANYILPLEPIQYATPANVQLLQNLMYRALYQFGAGGSFKASANAAALNTDLSLASPPVYSNGDKTVTITLKRYRWSDGAPVTARDVQFWQNLVTANKQDWFSYVPGAYPDNVVSTKVINSRTIQLNLNRAYQPLWFTYNELAQITPLPQHLWDKTCTSCKVGNDDMTHAGAIAVYSFLAGQAKNEATYTKNPLWKVVDGPWHLSGFDATTGLASFGFNSAYSGPVAQHHITKFVEKPFTSDTSEYNVLRGGGLTYGYIPFTEAGLHSALSSYRFAPWYVMIIAFSNINQNNPSAGAIFRQTYIRQAMEELVDQKGILAAYYGGYGTPTCGPVPAVPKNPWASPYERACPYKYNPSLAVRTLKAHGWKVVPGGVSSCSQPSRCGPGIAKGAKLEFNFLYYTGNSAFEGAVATEKSDAEKAGVRYNLQGAPFGTVVADSVQCGPGSVAPKANCGWQLSYWGGWGYEPDFYPTGELLFKTRAGANYDNYSSPSADRDIEATYLAGNATKTLDAYENLMVDQLPVLWQPNPDYQLSEIATSLKGATPQNGEAYIYPEEWYYSK